MDADNIVGTVTEEYTFKKSQIEGMGLTAVYSVQEVADILAANVEIPEVETDGTVDIVETNFNDSFHDMVADLRGEED